MKPFRSPPGGFIPPTNTPPAKRQPPNEIPSKSPTAKCHSSFCETLLTCTPSVGPVPVSSSVPSVQPSLHNTFASPPVANDNPPEEDIFSAPREEDIFKPLTWFLLAFLFSSSRSRQLPNFFLQHCRLLRVPFWRPISGAAKRHSSFAVWFPDTNFRTHQNYHATAISNWRCPY